jgi:hypothetical protein
LPNFSSSGALKLAVDSAFGSEATDGSDSP